MYKISLDLGFGATKITTDKDGVVTWFKETNAITKLGVKSDDIEFTGREKNVVEFNGAYYLVGTSALQYPDATVMNVLDYDSIKLISPIIAKKYLDKMEAPDQIVFSISSAYRKFSKDYKDYLSEQLGIESSRIKILPQGAGCKVALDHVGLDPNSPTNKNDYKSYLIVDIGFNTADVSVVIDGELDPFDIKGYEHEGVVKIAEKVQKQLKSEHDLEISIPRVRTLLDTKILKVRGKTYDCTNMIYKATEEYLTEFKDFLEKYYGDRMDVINNVILFGGGAELVKLHKDHWDELFDTKGSKFMVAPVSDSEFYNSIGGIYI